MSPWPGKCLTTGMTPPSVRPVAVSAAIRAAVSATELNARFPITVLSGLDQTSATGAKSRFAPSAPHRAASTRPSSRHRAGLPCAPKVQAAGRESISSGIRDTLPPSSSTARSSGI